MKNNVLVILLVALTLIFSGCTQNNNTETRYEPTPTTPKETTTVNTGDCISANESWNKIGEQACVEYNVVNAYKSKSGNIFLNEKSDYKTGFTTTIFASAAQNFNDPIKEYNQKTIQVSGLIKLYDGHPEIIAETPNQIKITE